MAITLKVKYFNTFILREEPIITTAVTNTHTISSSEAAPDNDITFSSANSSVAVGQRVHGLGITENDANPVTVATVTDASTIVLSTSDIEIQKGVTLTFSHATDPYANHGTFKDFHIEESRIKGGFNETSVDFGAKAFIVDKNFKRKHRENSMIYSGIFNSRTGVNNTNQFSIGQDITKSVDIINGSIQKLYAEDTNLTIFQEKKVSRALIDKDAIFTAEGSPLTTSSNIVIGQIQPYSGEYGISKNPESFAVYGNRKYFTDSKRGVVLRLSQDGITEISNYGMKSFFRDNLKNIDSAYGMFDMHSKSYTLSLVKSFTNFTKKDTETTYLNTLSKTAKGITKYKWGFKTKENSSKFKTLTFDDKVNGWTSFFTYNPEFGGSLAGDFYTFNKGLIYKHYQNNSLNTFYNEFKPSIIKIISNQNPSLVKYYKSINYEGTNNWKVTSLKSPADDDNFYEGYPIPGNISGRIFNSTEGVKYVGFTPLEKKYYGHVKINDTTTISGLNNSLQTGVKGYFLTTILEHQPVDNTGGINNTKRAELFSVGFNYEQSLY